MITAPATEALLLDRDHPEWRVLSEQPCNVLIEGTAAATDAALPQLQPHILEPIVWHRPTATLELPSGETRTLMLTDAAGLSSDGPQRVLARLGAGGARTR